MKIGTEQVNEILPINKNFKGNSQENEQKSLVNYKPVILFKVNMQSMYVYIYMYIYVHTKSHKT
jgi:hypothetical protein